MNSQMLMPLIYGLFGLSGFAGLIYESLWSRYLKILLGHASYGHILTLILFMGGLGLGSFWGGKWARKSQNPLLLYAGVEAIIGLGGLCYHALFEFAQKISFGLLPQVPGWAATPVKTLFAALITSPWAICLGITFPALAMGLIRLSQDSGKKSLPGLYFINSLGGAFGILLTSYFLIPGFGTPGSLMFAGFINLTLAGCFYFISKFSLLQHTSITTNMDAPLVSEIPMGIQVPVLLIISALTGLSSFLYEIVWIRLLSLVIGSSTHSFDLMVSAFILGLAGGGLFARRLMSTLKRPVRALAFIQIAMGVLAALSLCSYEALFQLSNQSHLVFQTTDNAYFFASFFKYGLCILLMVPASFFAGTTLPLITWILTHSQQSERYIGDVYGWNTIGSIIGAALGGLILMPWLQLKWTLLSGGLLDIGIGLSLIAMFPGQLKTLLTLAGCSLLCILPSLTLSLNNFTLTAGPFRKHSQIEAHTDEKIKVIHGRTATISFHDSENNRIIKTNGKPDASIITSKLTMPHFDTTTQFGLAMFPINLRQKPYQAAMIGMGSGMTAHILLGDPLLNHLDLIEIEPAMYELAKGFLPFNHRVYESPKVKMVFDDAKSYFHQHQSTYDVIISEPSNPWVSGVSGLFTEEFYKEIKGFLTEDGILVQWMHTYELDDPIFLSVLSALDRQFNYVGIYALPAQKVNSLNTGDIILIASQQKVIFPANLRKVNILEEELNQNLLESNQFSNANYLGSNQFLKPLLVQYNSNSDYYPILENGAEKALFKKSFVKLFEFLYQSPAHYQTLLEPEYQTLIQQRDLADQDVKIELLKTLNVVLQMPESLYKLQEVDELIKQLLSKFGAQLTWQEPELQAYQKYLQDHLLSDRLTQFQILVKLRQSDQSLNDDVLRALQTLPIEVVQVDLIRLIIKHCLQTQNNFVLEPLLEKWGTKLSESEQALIAALVLNSQSEVKRP